MKVTLAAFVLGALVTSSAIQADEIAGAGTRSCGEWIESRGNNSEDAYEMVLTSWVQGFLSGWNGSRVAHDEKTLPLPDHASIAVYIDKHCRENPLNQVLDATIALVTDLQKRSPG